MRRARYSSLPVMLLPALLIAQLGMQLVGRTAKAQAVENSGPAKVAAKAPSKIPKAKWAESLAESMKTVSAENPDARIGLYLKSLKTEKDFSFGGEEYWYVASGIKVPVALVVLKEIDAGQLTFATKVEVLESDYIDGAGELNFLKAGSLVSVRMLLDQSITFSDNTATDMLIRLVGLDKINEFITSEFPTAFTHVTTLIDVRRRIFNGLHEDAHKLTNTDYLKIKTMKDDNAKMDYVAKVLKVKRSDLNFKTLDAAYEAYYAEGVNSATLVGYGSMLEKLFTGKILKENTQRFLTNLMRYTSTGKERIKAGFPASMTFAHKTGSQYKRVCDLGIAYRESEPKNQYVLVACVRGVQMKEAEAILRRVGGVISDSGVFAKTSVRKSEK